MLFGRADQIIVKFTGELAVKYAFYRNCVAYPAWNTLSAADAKTISEKIYAAARLVFDTLGDFPDWNTLETDEVLHALAKKLPLYRWWRCAMLRRSPHFHLIMYPLVNLTEKASSWGLSEEECNKIMEHLSPMIAATIRELRIIAENVCLETIHLADTVAFWELHTTSW